MAAATPKDQLEDEIIKCSICFEIFKKPKYLPCLHTFCETCLGDYITSALQQRSSDSGGKTSRQFPCPICRTPVSAPDESSKPDEWASKLPVNHLIITLLDQKKLTSKDKLCDPCSQTDDHKIAVSWCTSCNEALCTTCVKYHKTLKITRKHQTIPLDNIGLKTKVIATIDFCEHHEEEKLKFYCIDHETPCCAICVTVHHRKCEHVKTLEEVAQGVREKQDLNDLSISLAEIAEELMSLLEERKTNLQDLEKDKSKFKTKIAKMRQDVNKHLDMLEDNLNRELSGTHKECEILVGNDIDEIENNLKIVNNCQKLLKTSVDNASDIHVFLEMTKLKHQQLDRSEKLRKLQKEIRRHDIKLRFEDSWMNLIKNLSKMGTIGKASIPMQNKQRNYEECIPKKLKSFSVGLFISSVVFLPGDKLLLADNSRKGLLFCDTNGNIHKEITVPGNPWDMVQINDSEVAVLLQNSGNIQFVNVDNMILGTLVTVNKILYRGIGYNGTNLIVGDNTKLYIIDSNGNIIQQISTGHSAEYIIESKSKIFYTSGSGLICKGIDGGSVFSYSGENFSYAEGIALDAGGNIYCCGNGSNNVHQLTPDGKLIKVLLTDLTYPCGIQFDKDSDRFLVTHNNDKVTIYEMSDS